MNCAQTPPEAKRWLLDLRRPGADRLRDDSIRCLWAVESDAATRGSAASGDDGAGKQPAGRAEGMEAGSGALTIWVVSDATPVNLRTLRRQSTRMKVTAWPGWSFMLAGVIYRVVTWSQA